MPDTVKCNKKGSCVACSFLVSSSTDSSRKYVLELMSVRAPLAEPPLLPNNCPSVLQLHAELKLNTSPLRRYWKHVWRTAATDSTSRWLTETSSMAWWSKSFPPRTTLQPSYKTKFCHSYRYHGIFYPLYHFVVVVVVVWVLGTGLIWHLTLQPAGGALNLTQIIFCQYLLISVK